MEFKRQEVKRLLDKMYETFDHSFLWSDPVNFVHRYEQKRDKEVIAFIASSFSYGRVTMIQKNLAQIFLVMGARPYEFIYGFDPERESRVFKGFKHRFNDETDLIIYITLIQKVLHRFGSIKTLFLTGYMPSDKDIKHALSMFIRRLYSIGAEIEGFNKSKGIAFLLPSPDRGSACKRLNLFLRWMIRKDRVDTGLWEEISPDKLFIPLDTHLARLSKYIGLTTRKSANWAMVEEITQSLKILDPKDPVKYDFSLCRLGILDECPSRFNIAKCNNCMIKTICTLNPG